MNFTFPQLWAGVEKWDHFCPIKTSHSKFLQTIPWCQTTSCLFNLMAEMKWSKTGRGANCPFTHFQDVWLRSLTPPTSSKWLSPLEMSCPLKAHEKETSRTGSLTTWQGNTMLSPTMISMSTGPWVILVGSVPRKIKIHIKRGSHFRPS